MPSRKFKVLALSLGKGMAQVIGLVSTVLMARILIKEDIAAYRQTFLAYATVAPILSLGIGQGIYYFLPAEKNRVRGRIAGRVLIHGLMKIILHAITTYTKCPK